MKPTKVVIFLTVMILLVGLVLGTSCGGRGLTGPTGVGIKSIVDNHNGTFTLIMTDNSTFTTDNLTGPQGPTAPQMRASLFTLPWEWDQNVDAFVITPGSLPEIDGSGFSDNTTVEIYLVVAPTNRILLAALTTNSLGCFYTDLSQLSTPIQVAPAADLDQTNGNETWRPCCFEGVVDGNAIATLPAVFFGENDVAAANTELHNAKTAVTACLFDANTSVLATSGAWNGSAGVITATGTSDNGSPVTTDASSYINGTFRATYTFDANGDLVSATLTPAPGNTAWTGIKWDISTRIWVQA